MRKKSYESFQGIVFTDTFSMSKQQGLDVFLFPELNKQLQKQKESKINPYCWKSSILYGTK